MEGEHLGDNESPGEIVEVDGVVFPKNFESNRPMKEHIDRIRALDVRDDDVFICAFAKSGTHWTWEVVNMLLSGKAEYQKQKKETMMLEVTEVETIEALPSPRVLNSHLPARMLPRQLQDKKGRIVFVYRNPKDIFISMYFHFNQAYPVTLQNLEQLFMTGRTVTGDYFRYMKEMDEFTKKNPQLKILKISFEDMKEDPVAAVGRYAEFLGVAVTPTLCTEIADACGFQKLKHFGETYKESSDFYIRTNMSTGTIFRKGEVGDWKNYMTVAQSERFDAAIQQLDGCDFRFRYQL
ncbi:sulfotransferase 1A1-like [Pomacea canaliculata]|uniref:sulfotransferase 1A1-like n=1 Tax=Pomacea canaliculata TaxID=400727 RepID=UPI000D72B7E5|nr:sulfotransferase 1A1-like [Pomacea canaliculata]